MFDAREIEDTFLDVLVADAREEDVPEDGLGIVTSLAAFDVALQNLHHALRWRRCVGARRRVFAAGHEGDYSCGEIGERFAGGLLGVVGDGSSTQDGWVDGDGLTLSRRAPTSRVLTSRWTCVTASASWVVRHALHCGAFCSSSRSLITQNRDHWLRKSSHFSAEHPRSTNGREATN